MLTTLFLILFIGAAVVYLLTNLQDYRSLTGLAAVKAVLINIVVLAALIIAVLVGFGVVKVAATLARVWPA